MDKMTPSFHEDFPRDYEVRFLKGKPLILPQRYFVFPQLVDEIEKDALLLEVLPASASPWTGAFALGFVSSAVASGVFSCPDPRQACVVSGGYAYLVDTLEPATCRHLRPRPVVQVRAVPESRRLLLCDFTTITAIGPEGISWETPPLTWEGLSLGKVEQGILHGTGWDAIADREVPFTVELASGHAAGGATPPPNAAKRDGHI